MKTPASLLLSDSSGCCAALFVGFFLTYSNLGFFASLLTFFLIGSKATKYKSSIKRTFESDHKEGEGQRNWVQVLCNGGIPTQLSVLFLLAEGPSEHQINFRYGNHRYQSIWSLLRCFGWRFWSSVLIIFPSLIFCPHPSLFSSSIFTVAQPMSASFLAMSVIAALSCCLGDTLASEIGSVAAGESPR